MNSITKEDLDELKEEIVGSIERLEQELTIEADLKRRWLRTSEVAQYLGLSESQINTLKAKGRLSCRKLGGTNYYDKREIDNQLIQENNNEV